MTDRISTASIVEVAEKLDPKCRLVAQVSLADVAISMLPFAAAGALTYYDGTDSGPIEALDNVLLFCLPELANDNPRIDYLHVVDPKAAFYHASHLFGSNSDFEIDHELSSNFAGVTIGVNCQIGANVELHPNVVIRSNTVIEDNCVIESGSVIGSSGLLWTWDGVTQRKVMLSLTGGTILGDGTYFCANNSVVRGACGETTTVGNAVMIAPSSAIGHGACIGDETHFANGVLIGGTAIVEPRCFLGSGSIIQPGLTLAEGSVLGAGATLTRTTGESGVYAGTPARRIGDITSALKGVPGSHKAAQDS